MVPRVVVVDARRKQAEQIMRSKLGKQHFPTPSAPVSAPRGLALLESPPRLPPVIDSDWKV